MRIRSSQGFTLIEMVIAVAIASALAGSIYAALVSTARTSERQRAEGQVERSRMRSAELLRGDLRARKDLKVEGAGKLSFVTTAEPLGLGEPGRFAPSIRYTATEKGLLREEGAWAVTLLDTPVGFEFWDGALWGPVPKGEILGVAVVFEKPRERVVIR